MKKLLGIVVLGLFSVNIASAKVNSYNLSNWYDGCMQGAKAKGEYSQGVKICTCAVEIMNEKLSNREFEKMFIKERWKVTPWMQENVLPYCN